MKKYKKIILMIIPITVMLTACSTSNSKVDTRDRVNMESYSIIINKVKNKKSNLVGDIVFDKDLGELYEVTGTNAKSISVSVDEGKKVITIKSDKRNLDTGGNLVIKFGVPIDSIYIDQGNFNLDIFVDSIEKFRGVFESGISGEIRSENVKEFNLDLLGAGNITLSGNAESANILIQGSSILQGKEMKVKDMKFKLEGTGSGSVYASNSLDASVDGIGGISYSGNPEKVNKKVNGIGFIRELN
ncbi:hypothetical protein AB685_16855 [Bacillus sp. LL01]|uniref:GIN domain-containing protein n=1 Tax=Bacillus sp. LL01 TaxID=1665556 RepID=UPI00064CE64C|nr:DUF2807 domain-containing protein [Bacillus sp. LL01]KMJ57657.1 hypothetical protein AB685_16855 [Bacillus sp. LL01]